MHLFFFSWLSCFLPCHIACHTAPAHVSRNFSMNSFVMHAAPRELESTSSTMKWPDGDAAQKTEELDFRPMFNEVDRPIPTLSSEMHSEDLQSTRISEHAGNEHSRSARQRCRRQNAVCKERPRRPELTEPTCARPPDQSC